MFPGPKPNMPVAFLFPILLRLAGPLAFAFAAIAAGVMNRSFIIVPLLAVIASLTTVIIRKVSPSPAMDLKAMMTPDAAPQPANPFRGVGRRFAIGLVGYAVLFGLAASIAAIFQTTEFEPQLMPTDMWFTGIPAVIAFVGAWVSARIGLNQMASMMGGMQDVFNQMQSGPDTATADDEDAFTFEGEVIDPDERDS